MNLLLDTCAFLWLTGYTNKLSPRASAAIIDPANYIFLSTVSAWEIAIKYGTGGLTLSSPPRIFVPQKCAAQGISILDLNLAAALRTNALPSIHRDPFDRILICQALEADMTLVTADLEIQAYPVRTLW